jgi:hypothetical protein
VLFYCAKKASLKPYVIYFGQRKETEKKENKTYPPLNDKKFKKKK